ncbi:MAG TPA: fused MFS/spermidine synthase [Gaiellaceae bacterium]|nr:fused MFS/spermidine synthase [Gaiellaceae bacterium]
MRPSSQATLTGVVFAAGVGTLATEIGASRLLAPYFGNSTIVWANVIGLTLASLSVGYWLGGRLADRRPTPRALGFVVVSAACLIALATLVARPILDLSVEGLDRVSAGAAIGSFFGVLVLFVPPVTLMGMVAPFAIRLAITGVETAGTVAGRLYAVSTVGSLLGTFLSALVLIPAIGTQRTLLAAAALIGAGGAVLLGRRWIVLAAALAALLLIPPGAVKAQSGLIYEDESRYQFIQVVEREGVRRLYLDEGLATHSVWRRDEVLTGGVWDTYVAVVDLLGREPRRVAMLGNAAGTAARAYARFYPTAKVDGVELDPAVSAAGRRYFEMGRIGTLSVHDGDARAYLRRTDERYDVIIVDAYRPPYVPFYLATKEFFRLVRDRLTPGGIVALNVATTPDNHDLAKGIGGTLASVLPRATAWQPLRFNQIVIGQNGDPTGTAHPAPDAVEPLVRDLRTTMRPIAPSDDPWTDDRAPVEWITDRMIVEFAAEGGRFEEAPLPTAP